MRVDGSFAIYMIQHKEKGGGWVFSNFDSFGSPPGFMASDDCWQQTGVMGTFETDTAVKALRWISKRNAKYKFRLVLRITTQTTFPIGKPNAQR